MPHHETSPKRLTANRANAARSTGPRTPEGKARSAQNSRKHGFTASNFAVVRAEDLEAVANLKEDLVSVYQPLDAQELFAVERIALAQHALLRAARLEAGLFTCAVNQSLDDEGNFLKPMSQGLLEGAEMTDGQNFNHALADGFRRMASESDVWKLFFRYQAQSERNYRRAVEEFDRLKGLRAALPNEPILEAEPKSPQPVKPVPDEPFVPRNNFVPSDPKPAAMRPKPAADSFSPSHSRPADRLALQNPSCFVLSVLRGGTVVDGMSRSLLTLLASLPLLAAGAESNAIQPVDLRQGWAIRSSADVRESGAALSTPAYDPRGWYPATLPSTVLHALVESHVYPDPYFGMNLRSIPGASYPISTNFSNLQMPPDSPFRHSWWYRASLQLDATYKGKTVWLGFDGINFRANVWLNGRQIADSSKMPGAWRLYQFDVTAAARPGEANVLAVEVFPPTPRDLSIAIVDWNPQPPDKNMGLWRDVWVAATGPVAIRFPSVTTKLAGGPADLTVRAELTNASGSAVEGVLEGRIEGQKFSQAVRLGSGETRVARAKLKLEHPRLWWPAQVGEQNLYSLDLQFLVDGQVSDAGETPFGVREVTSEIDAKGHRLFHINGKNILIRGGRIPASRLLGAVHHQDFDWRLAGLPASARIVVAPPCHVSLSPGAQARRLRR